MEWNEMKKELKEKGLEWNGMEWKEKGMELRRNEIGMKKNWTAGKEK